jgi:phosphoserine / homoserine phosphotransferase
MYIVCSDLEGVFVPEIWINVAEKTGIDELRLTTRDINDYDLLMKGRLEILRQHGLTIHDIRNVISTIRPLPGALEFIKWLRNNVQLILVSDTFTEFAGPLLEQIGRPILFCNHLTLDDSGNIADYNLRQPEGKKKVVEAMQNLNFKVISIGDSYNDISMLRKADFGVLYKPPKNVIYDNNDLPVVKSYYELKNLIKDRLDHNKTKHDLELSANR